MCLVFIDYTLGSRGKSGKRTGGDVVTRDLGRDLRVLGTPYRPSSQKGSLVIETCTVSHCDKLCRLCVP